MTSDPDSAPPAAVWAGLRRLAELPAWLRDGVRSDLVGAALGAVSDFAGGMLTVHGCRVRQPRLDGDHWTARYQLTVQGPGWPLRRVALVGELYPPGTVPPGQRPTGAFGFPGWRGRLPELGLTLLSEPTDLGLPALRILTDQALAPGVLERTIRASTPAYADLEIAACTPRLLRQHPGRRATLGYDLTYPCRAEARDWPEQVFAKTYADDTGRQTDRAMRALWAARLPGLAPSIAEPLGYLPELRLLVQGPVSAERTLADLLRQAMASGEPKATHELVAAAEQAAVALAALHTSNVDYGPPVGIEDELADLATLADRLAGLVGQLAGAAAPLLGWLAALAVREEADAAVPSHGSFHPGQVLLSHDRVGVIDFDGLCRAEPAHDVAQFLATTKYLAVAASRAGGNPPPGLDHARLLVTEHVCARFQQRYQTLAPLSPTRVALWETVHLFTHVLHCWTGIRPHRLGSTLALLCRQLRELNTAS